MKLWDKFVALFDTPDPDWRDEHQIDEQHAAHVFNTYYRAALARYNPAFLTNIEPHSWALSLIEDLSKCYGMPVPNNCNVALDPDVYKRIQRVLIAIERR